MARGITQDRVNNAADALLQRGERPTIEKVRAELGTGSPNTLMRMLEVWWAGLAARLAAQARADLPGIPESVQRGMMTLWSEAVVACRRDAETGTAERERLVVQREAETLEQLRLAQETDAARQTELVRVVGELKHVHAALAQERQHSAALQESLSEAVRSLHEAQTTIEAVRRSGEEAQKRYRGDLDRATAAEQRWLKEVDRAREEAKAVVRELKSVRLELAKQQQRHVRLSEQHTAEKREFQLRMRALKKRASPSATPARSIKRNSKQPSRNRTRSP